MPRGMRCPAWCLEANHPDQEAVSGTKPEPYQAEYLFWNNDGYQLEIKGANSEKTKVISTDVQKIPWRTSSLPATAPMSPAAIPTTLSSTIAGT